MKIGITQQPEISGKVLELINFIEIKTLSPENIKEFSKYKKPFLFHVQNIKKRKTIFIADDDLVELLSDAKIKEIIRSSQFPWISFHLGLPVKSFVFDKNQDFIATSPPISKKEFFKKVSLSLQQIKKLYPDFKILLETPPFVPHFISKGAYYYICEPDFINRILDKNDCYFLLDIGHTTVSAYNLGFKKPEDYFEKLPLKRTLEIHIHRPRESKKEGLWRDAHLPISKREMESLKFILQNAQNVKAITLEAAGLHKRTILIKELKMLKDINLCTPAWYPEQHKEVE